MRPICTMECEDCGKFIIVDENYISVFVLEDEAVAISRCAHCDRAVFQEISFALLEPLAERDVKVFDWMTGTDYAFE